MPLRLFLHAFRTIFGNLREALTISVVPFGALFLLLILFGQTADLNFGQEPSGGVFFGAILFLIAFLIAFGFAAASWHRFVLLEETPKIIGSEATGRALPYVGQSILLGLWISLFVFPIMLVVGFIFAALTGGGDAIGTNAPNYGLGDVVFEIVVGGIAVAIGWVYAMVLPASALNSSMTFRESRLATTRLGLNLLWLGMLFAGFNVLMNVVLGAVFASGGGLIADILSLAIQWLLMMVGISILTTLYGHLVEGRNLPT